MVIMQRFLICAAFCLMALVLPGCADLERKLDIAMFGSEEEAVIAKQQMAEESAEREILDLRKMEEKTFKLLNEKREQARVSTIDRNHALQMYATIRAQEFSEGFGPIRADGSDITEEFRLKGLSKPESVVHTWMTNIKARNALLDSDLMDFAVGVFKQGSAYYWVLVPSY